MGRPRQTDPDSVTEADPRNHRFLII